MLLFAYVFGPENRRIGVLSPFFLKKNLQFNYNNRTIILGENGLQK